MVSRTPLGAAFEDDLRRGERLEFGMEWCIPRAAMGPAPTVACYPKEGGVWMVGVGTGADRAAYFWSAFGSMEDATEECGRLKYFIDQTVPRDDYWFEYYRDRDEADSLQAASESREPSVTLRTRATAATAAAFLGEFLATHQWDHPVLVVLDAVVFCDFLEGLFDALPPSLPGMTDSGVGEDGGVCVVYWGYGAQRVFCAHSLLGMIVTPETDVWDLREEPDRGVIGRRVVTYEFLQQTSSQVKAP